MLGPTNRYWLCQVLGWTGWCCFYFYTNSVGYIDSLTKAFLYCFFLITAGIGITFGYRWLLLRLHWPDLPLKKLLPRVVVAVLLMTFLLTALNLLIERETFPQFLQDISPILLVRYGGAWLQLLFIYAFIYHGYIYYQRAIVAEKAKAGAELEALRSQIHPHFYFNTLNNLYGLAMERSPRTEEAILRLASIMEYVIYDCRTKTVNLQKEISFIQSYVELEKLRCEPEADIRLLITLPGEADLRIAPLLLIPFVENAFKHGLVRQQKDAAISISIGTEDGAFCFTVINDAPPGGPAYATRWVSGAGTAPGVGLDNVRRRLDHLYPGKYRLTTGFKKQEYHVCLTIAIECLSNVS
jgi:sensor histidine kinase YesM